MPLQGWGCLGEVMAAQCPRPVEAPVGLSGMYLPKTRVIKPPAEKKSDTQKSLACSNSEAFQPKMAGGWEEGRPRDGPLKKIIQRK